MRYVYLLILLFHITVFCLVVYGLGGIVLPPLLMENSSFLIAYNGEVYTLPIDKYIVFIATFLLCHFVAKNVIEVLSEYISYELTKHGKK